MTHQAEWTERDLLFATAMFTRNLAAYLTISGVLLPEKLAGILKITVSHLEKDGDPGGARMALEEVYREPLTAQLQNILRLLDKDSTQGSA